MSAPFNLVSFFDEKAKWSLATFGPQQRVTGVIAHIRKELAEIREALAAGDSRKACEEFVDVALLAIDLAWRSGPGVDGVAFVAALNKCQRFWAGDSTFDGAASAAIQGMLLGAVEVEVHLSAIERSGLWWPIRVVERAGIIWEIAMAGAAAEQVEAERRLLAKYDEVKKRMHPDWRAVPADQPIEHIRESDSVKPGTISYHRHDSRGPVLLIDVPPNGVIKGGDTMTIAQLVAERAEWRANNDRLREERQKVREILGARPSEGVIDAAKRVASSAAAVGSVASGLAEAKRALGARIDEDVASAARRFASDARQASSPAAALAPGEEAPQ